MATIPSVSLAARAGKTVSRRDRNGNGQRPSAAPEPSLRPLAAGPAPVLLLVVACVLLLAGFGAKAFHIDDPLFLWSAAQIRAHPLDFYGFSVNWYKQWMSMSQVTMNPPLTSYYLALVTSALGASEIVVHLAFLPWAIGAVLGTYRLAQRLCEQPLLAALATLVSPVFLVSSTNVMCDTMMLCLWTWAVVWWLRGLDTGQRLSLFWSGLLAGLALLTKYFAFGLVPLLLVYTIARRRKAALAPLTALVIPVAIAAAYQALTHRLYGHGLLSAAASYANEKRSRDLFANAVVGLAFTGGCVGSVLFYLPFLWPRRLLVEGLGLALLLALARLLVHIPNEHLDIWWEAIQLAIFVAGGLCVAALAATDLWRRRDAESLLLFCWVAGTFVFAAFVNWTLNGRSLLPMAPAAAILLIRRLEETPWLTAARSGAWQAVPLIPTAALGLVVAIADYQLADSARLAATRLTSEYASRPGKMWFEGHWGFQYYMQRLGGKPIDYRKMPGHESPWVLFLPRNSTYVLTLNPKETSYGIHSNFIEDMHKVAFSSFPWLATMHPALEAGFYSCSEGESLPYVFASALPEEYWVVVTGPEGPGRGTRVRNPEITH